MSVCGQSGQTEEDSGSEEVTATAAAVRDIYKQKPASKVVRVLTVLAYLLSVSLAAILLSVYYVCVWKSPELPPQERGVGAPRALAHPRGLDAVLTHNLTGGGDSGVSSSEPPYPVNVTDVQDDGGADTTTDSSTDESTTNTTPDSLNSTYDSVNDTEVT